MLWHFRANLQQGSENFATRLWQRELEDMETAQAHMGKLSKNILPSSIFIACTVKILYALLLTKLFLWDCNHSSSQLKNHQAARRTLEGQTEWLTSGSVHRAGPTAVQRTGGPGCWDGAVSSRTAPLPGEPPSTQRATPCPCLATHLLDPDSRSRLHLDLPHYRNLPSLADPSFCCRAGRLTSRGAWHGTAPGQPPHCTLTVIHWHISYCVLIT